MNTKESRELTRLIGRRLREACERDFAKELPAAISGGLAALREEEMRRSDIAEGSKINTAPSPGAMRDHQ